MDEEYYSNADNPDLPIGDGGYDPNYHPSDLVGAAP
jgi:hypothetical protein